MSERFPPARCDECGGPMVAGRVSQGELLCSGPIIYEQLPAFICQQCGFTTIPAGTWGELDRLAAERPAPVRYVSVPVYDLSGLPAADVQIPPRRPHDQPAR